MHANRKAARWLRIGVGILVVSLMATLVWSSEQWLMRDAYVPSLGFDASITVLFRRQNPGRCVSFGDALKRTSEIETNLGGEFESKAFALPFFGSYWIKISAPADRLDRIEQIARANLRDHFAELKPIIVRSNRTGVAGVAPTK